MEIAKLYELRNIAYSLGNRIDPTSQIAFPNDTIMNHPQIIDYNKKVCELLDSLIISYKSKKDENLRKIPFFMTKEDIEEFQYSYEPISISKICFKMNEHIPKGMAKISAAKLAGGLTKLGFLIEKDIDEKKSYKMPTDRGIQMGIVGVKKTNSYGNEYYVNLYDMNAQSYVINNYNEILLAYESNNENSQVLFDLIKPNGRE